VRLRLWLTLAKASVLSSSALVLVRFNCPLGARCGLVVNECELGRLALPHEWRITEDFDCDAAQLIREVRIGGKVEINPDDIAARDARSGLLERFPVPLPQVFTRGELGVTVLHGSAGGHSGPPLDCVQVMRTDFGRPSSNMRFRTMTPTVISVA
jgi:hypothetical protein